MPHDPSPPDAPADGLDVQIRNSNRGQLVEMHVRGPWLEADLEARLLRVVAVRQPAELVVTVDLADGDPEPALTEARAADRAGRRDPGLPQHRADRRDRCRWRRLTVLLRPQQGGALAHRALDGAGEGVRAAERAVAAGGVRTEVELVGHELVGGHVTGSTPPSRR